MQVANGKNNTAGIRKIKNVFEENNREKLLPESKETKEFNKK